MHRHHSVPSTYSEIRPPAAEGAPQPSVSLAAANDDCLAGHLWSGGAAIASGCRQDQNHSFDYSYTDSEVYKFQVLPLTMHAVTQTLRTPQMLEGGGPTPSHPPTRLLNTTMGVQCLGSSPTNINVQVQKFPPLCRCQLQP